MIASQAGHVIAYQARFGPAARSLQSSGAHGYFPGTLKASLGAACLAALTALFAIGLARVLCGRRLERGSAPQYLRLLAALYALQLAVFAGQEVAEALTAGAAAPSAAGVLLWGTLGQLPVALVAAAALRLLLARFDQAVSIIRAALHARPPAIQHPPAAAPVRHRSNRDPFAGSDAAHVPGRRGPPSSSRLSFS